MVITSDDIKTKFSSVFDQVDEIHELGTIYEAEIKKFKRDKSDQDGLNQNLINRLNEYQIGQDTV